MSNAVSKLGRCRDRLSPGLSISVVETVLLQLVGGVVWCGRCSDQGWLAGADMGADLGQFIGHPVEHGVVGPVGRTGLLARGPRLLVRSNKVST